MPSPIVDQVIEILTSNADLPAMEITPDTELEDLELDSLILIELAVILQQRLGVPVSHEELAAHRTIGEVGAMLSAKGVTV